MLADLLNTPCTITTRIDGGDTGIYGDELTIETSSDTLCELQQQQRTETASGELARSTWLLLLPAGTAIDSGDEVTVLGERFEVIGEPWHVRNPRTHAQSHIEATVRRTAGDEEVS